MKLIFNNLKPIDGLIQWLKNFSTLSSSLLIEVDTQQQKFVSKAFTPDKGLVRYSEISFEDACLSLDETSDVPDCRLKLGIFLTLPKLIKICETYSSTAFTITIDYEENQEGSDKYISDYITFQSKTLKMRIDECAPSEFTYLDDKIFNDNIHVAPNPVVVTINADVIKNLIAISDVFALEPKKDIMIFYSQKTKEGNALYVKDRNSSYEYQLGIYSEDPKEFKNFSATIFRDKFLLSMKGNSENIQIALSTSEPSRILFDSASGATKTVISIVNQ